MTMSRPSASVAALPSILDCPEIEETSDEIVLLNKAGQKLGRKGLETREKILSATKEILDIAPSGKLTPSSITRRAGLASQSFYLYFENVKEVLLALCEETVAEMPPIVSLFKAAVASGHEPDMMAFVRAHYEFSRRHLPLFTLRNYFSDNADLRFYSVRARCSIPILNELARVMAERGDISEARAKARAVVVIAGLERMSTRQNVATEDGNVSDDDLLQAETDILLTLMEYAAFGQ